MQIQSSETVFQGRVFDVRVDHLRSRDGRPGRVDLVVHPGSVTILPVDDRGRVIFVKQYRHPTGGDLLELPAGTLEKGEAALECARRETEEEIGMSPSDLLQLGSCYLAPGYTTEETHIFLARSLSPIESRADPDEDIKIVKHDLPTVASLTSSGQINDAKTLAALWLAFSKGFLPGFSGPDRISAPIY